ncbi:MAG: hypothetical protein E4H20_01885 [Spirochaetales bacterium]|nr:MAG: hypothetical protein E4H20_01885 [Spirochaetales bacterium]
MQARKMTLIALFSFVACVATTAQAELSISLFDKRIYVPGSEIPVKVTVRNLTAAPFRFRLAEQRRRSIGFDVRSLSNRALEASDSWKRAMASNTPVYYRELSLLPGEEYSFVEDLRDYIMVDEPGAYLVRCSFWPELDGNPAPSGTIQSNTLSISVRPGVPSPAATELFRAGAVEVLKPEQIPPDQVISRTIQARQKGQWNEFFLYLDLERLFLANPDKKRAYDRESDDGRRRMLETYKADLMASVIDKDIVVVPSSFTIVETRYRETSGTVTANLKFAYDGFSMIKQYTYEMAKRDSVWLIVGYTVLNKGTE